MRKLAWLCAGVSGAVVLSEYTLSSRWMLWAGLCCAVCAGLSFLLSRKRRLLVLLLCLGCAVGFFRSWVHEQRMILPAEALAETEQTVTARVVEYPQIYDNGQYMVVRLDPAFGGIRCRLNSYDEDLANLRPGDEIRVAVDFRSARYRYGEETEYYNAKDIFLLGVCQNRPFVTGRWDYAFLYAPQNLARAISEQCHRMFPEDTAAFMTGLLSGDKTDLYEDELLYTQINRAGLSHVVAVSGMHISFLMGFIALFIGNRRGVVLVSLPVLLVFCAMVGFTPSVCRAAFMQCYLLAAGLLNRDGDSPTSLSVILSVLLLENPSAATSVGLQLSFAATAGIVLLSGRVYSAVYEWLRSRFGHGRYTRKILAGISGNIAATTGALVFTTPLTALHFGIVSVVAPISNLLCLPVVSLLFVGGYVVVVLGSLIPVAGMAAGWILSWAARYLFAVSAGVGWLPHPVVCTDSGVFALWLVLVYLLFAVAWVQRGRDASLRPVVPLCLSLLLLYSFFAITELTRDRDLTVTVLDVGQGQCIVMENDGYVTVVDCGSTASEKNAGDIAMRYLLSRGQERVDMLVLTHGHVDHANGAARLLAGMDVGQLVIPAQMNRTDSLAGEILNVAQKKGTEVYYLQEDVDYAVGKGTLSLWSFEGKQTDYEKGLAVMMSRNDFEILIPGDMQSYSEWLHISKRHIPDMEVLVVGHHGSDTSTGERLLKAARPDVAIISVGYNSYGHPHEDVLRRLEAHNIRIHRTDREGNIRIRE